MVRRPPQAKHSTASLTYTEGGCMDGVTLSVDIRQEKIIGLSVKLSRSSCEALRKASTLLEQHVKGKHIGDAYKVSLWSLDGEKIHDHGTTLMIHALRQAILDYESKKAEASLQEALAQLQGYDEGLPERDLRTDYEY